MVDLLAGALAYAGWPYTENTCSLVQEPSSGLFMRSMRRVSAYIGWRSNHRVVKLSLHFHDSLNVDYGNEELTYRTLTRSCRARSSGPKIALGRISLLHFSWANRHGGHEDWR